MREVDRQTYRDTVTEKRQEITDTVKERWVKRDKGLILNQETNILFFSTYIDRKKKDMRDRHTERNSDREKEGGNREREREVGRKRERRS
jgi:hypothetical protein